jgi:CNT family concentrative nucleoside transporter
MTPLPTLVAATSVTLMDRFIPVIGLITFLGIALAFSKDRQLALKNWRLIVFGFGLQFGFALIVLKTTYGRAFFKVMNDFFVAVVNSTQEGATFVFGNLAKGGGPDSLGFFFAFNVLPTIIFFSALSAILFRLGIIQVIVRAIAAVMQYTMKTSGAETLSASANIFLGQTEAPLIVRPFIPRMTNSEIMAVMTGGFATIAGGVLAAYIGFLQDRIPGIAGHLLAASVMSAPAGLLFAKLLWPESGTPETAAETKVEIPMEYDSVLDAATSGASEGVKLALNVAGMLIAFLALIAFLDLGLSHVGGAIAWATSAPGTEYAADPTFNLRLIIGEVFRPLAWVMGIPWAECGEAGKILGVKTVANEFIAYLDLSAAKDTLSERTSIILSYALCGFSNLSSIGIQIGALSIMAPERRADLVKIALPAMVAGSLACFSTACFAAILM